MLQTETNTIEMYQRVKKAATKILKTNTSKVAADFEHGQWWVTDLRSGAQYSVVDAEGGSAVDGFDLEQVTEGDER